MYATSQPAAQEAVRLILLPALDLTDGQVDRTAGGAGQRSPLDVAADLVRSGARWLHVVDLDAAHGRGTNRDLVEALIGCVEVPVEVSGGIRDRRSLAWALSTHARRVVLSSDALADPGWCRAAIEEHGDRVAVAVDVRAGRLVSRGWPFVGDPVDDVLRAIGSWPRTRLIVTDADRDGAMRGPGLSLIRRVCELTGGPVIASGGISSLADLRRLTELVPLGLEGAVIGKALHTGAVSLAEALAVAG